MRVLLTATWRQRCIGEEKYLSVEVSGCFEKELSLILYQTLL